MGYHSPACLAELPRAALRDAAQVLLRRRSMSTSAYTVSVTSTYSEARARYVLGKVKDELLAFTMRGLLPIEEARRWCDDLLYLLDLGAIDHFEVQCHTPSGRCCGLGY